MKYIVLFVVLLLHGCSNQKELLELQRFRNFSLKYWEKVQSGDLKTVLAHSPSLYLFRKDQELKKQIFDQLLKAEYSKAFNPALVSTRELICYYVDSEIKLYIEEIVFDLGSLSNRESKYQYVYLLDSTQWYVGPFSKENVKFFSTWNPTGTIRSKKEPPQCLIDAYKSL